MSEREVVNESRVRVLVKDNRDRTKEDNRAGASASSSSSCWT